MTVFSERRWFREQGDGYVFRHTPFSPGYLLSGKEKGRMMTALLRSERRSLVEGTIVVAAITAFALAAPLGGANILARFAGGLIAVLPVLMAIAMLRRRKFIDEHLSGCVPLIPRLSFREALMLPRPILTRRIALLAVRAGKVATVVMALGINALVIFRLAQGMRDVEGAVSAVLGNPSVWVLCVTVTVPFALAYGVLVLIGQHWRGMPPGDPRR